MKLTRCGPTCRQFASLAVVMLAWLLAGAATGQAQTTPPAVTTPQAAFVAYRCEFDPQTNSAMIRAVLTGSDGLPIRRENYTVSVSQINTGTALDPEKVDVAAVPDRPPL